jgi:hypothetical protein
VIGTDSCPALKLKTKKNNEKQSGSAPQVEPVRRTARGAERRFEVVFEFLIFRLDFLFLLYQDKRKI